MKKTYEDIRFSTVVRYEDGSKGNEIGITETLVIEWDADHSIFKANNPGGHESWIGHGKGHTEAVLEYLKARLGIGHEQSHLADASYYHAAKTALKSIYDEYEQKICLTVDENLNLAPSLIGDVRREEAQKVILRIADMLGIGYIFAQKTGEHGQKES